jgi:hypothetical protein
MATYAKDFSDEGTTGVFASDFTVRYATMADWTIEATADAEDDRAFRSDGTGSGTQLASWDDVDGDANRDNCELLVRYKVSSSADQAFEAWARASGSTSSETGYHIRNVSGVWRLYRSVSSYPGTNVALFTYDDVKGAPISTQYSPAETLTSPAFPTDAYQWLRMRVNGTGATVTIQCRFWLDNDVEPTTWQIDYDDTNAARITAAGWIGFGRDAHSNTTDVDYFSVGTNGDAAPKNVSTNTILRLTQSGAEVMIHDDDPEFRITNIHKQYIYAEGSPSQQVAPVVVMLLT